MTLIKLYACAYSNVAVNVNDLACSCVTTATMPTTISPYHTALAKVAAALTIKVGMLNLLTVRSTGNFGRTANAGKLWHEDTIPRPMQLKLFTILMGAVGPTPPTERLCGVVANANENEPYFLALACATALVGPPTWGATALYAYLGSRIAHMIVFLVDFPESVVAIQGFCRANAYLVGVFTSFTLAGHIISK